MVQQPQSSQPLGAAEVHCAAAQEASAPAGNPGGGSARGADAAGNVSDAGLLAAPRHVEGNVHVVHLPRADSATAALAAADRAMIALSGAGRLGDTRNMSSASATSSASQFLAEQEALVGGRRVNAASFLSCRRRGAPMRFGSRAGWS